MNTALSIIAGLAAYVVYLIRTENSMATETAVVAAPVEPTTTVSTTKPRTPRKKKETPVPASVNEGYALTSSTNTAPSAPENLALAVKPAKTQATRKKKDTSSVEAVVDTGNNKPEAIAEPAKSTGAKGLKNPKTGETAAYTNYRFAKRWIKEALVAEKLLDKIYKTTELTEDVEAVIKPAIEKLQGMKKYKA